MNEAPTLPKTEVDQIRDLLSEVAYILDAHDYDRLGAVFAEDVRFENPGRLEARSLPVLVESFKNIADPAISHHVTNVVVTPIDERTAECRTKALTLRKGGALTAAEYSDTVHRGADGWRITSRYIRPLG